MQEIKQNILDNINAIALMYTDHPISYGLMVRLHQQVERAEFQEALVGFDFEEPTVYVAAVYKKDVAYVAEDGSYVLLVSKFEDDMIQYAGYYDFIVTVFCNPPDIGAYVMHPHQALVFNDGKGMGIKYCGMFPEAEDKDIPELQEYVLLALVNMRNDL